MGRPTHEPFATVYGWLAANGVDEWIPENLTVKVDHRKRTITYTSYEWHGARGWDAGNMAVKAGDVRTQDRTVPLVVPLDDRVRQCLRDGGATLFEVGHP